MSDRTVVDTGPLVAIVRAREEAHAPDTPNDSMHGLARWLPRAIRCTMGFMEPIITHEPEPHGEPTTLPVITEYIGVRPGYCGGEPHILGHRIKVRHVAVWHEQMGMTPTEIAATYPTITLAQVHAALAYYYDHRDEIRAAIEDEHRFVEELKAKTPSLLQEKLKRLKGEDVTDDTLPPG